MSPQVEHGLRWFSVGERSSGFFARNRSALLMGLLALVIAGTADLFAGLCMVNMEEYIMMVPGMVVLIYAAIGMRGNIFGAMGSRLGTAMHMGTFKMDFRKGILRSNMEGAMTLTMLMSVVMAVFGWVIVRMIFGEAYDFLKFVFISTFGGLLAGLLVMAVNIIIVKVSYEKDWDVDNITAPLIAAAGDVITVPMIFVATILAVNLNDELVHVLSILLILLTAALTAYILLRKRKKKKKRKRKMDEAKRIVRQSLPVLTACVFLELMAGLLIENETELLVEHAVLLLLLTAFLNEGNALSGMLTSRLSSMLHMGTLPRQNVPPKEAAENFGIMYILAILTFLYIMTVAFVIQPHDVNYLMLLAIVMISGLIITTVINFLSYYVALAALRFNLDPDDHCIPITSSVMDVVGSAVLVAVILLLI